MTSPDPITEHRARLAAARQTIDYICTQDPDAMRRPVPNCPGWTVYNAAVHVGRVGIAWRSMIDATPDDPDSRARGYADAESRGSGHDGETLASWAHHAIDALETEDLERPCYFSMTGGHGTVALWGRHAASELAVHRLDIEDALGSASSIGDELALDALDYTANYFLPAMMRATATFPGSLDATPAGRPSLTTRLREPAGDGGAEAAVRVEGSAEDLLRLLWGRPHGPIDVTGSEAVLDAWKALPGSAFQFGTWD